MNKTIAWATALAIPFAMSSAFAQTAAPTNTGPAMSPHAGMAPGGSMASSSTANLSAGDKKFVEKAAIGGMAEVQLAQLAQQKSQDPAVKDFAQHMIDDHTPNNDQLMKLASQKGVTPPAELDTMHQSEMSKLQALDGKKFDRAYLKGQVRDHEAMLKTFQAESTNGKDTDLKAFADQTVPTIQKHITMAQAPKSGA